MNGTWEVRRPGGTEFVPVPDDGCDRGRSSKGFSALVVPMGSSGAEYRFRSSTGAVYPSTRVDNDFPAMGRGLDG